MARLEAELKPLISRVIGPIERRTGAKFPFVVILIVPVVLLVIFVALLGSIIEKADRATTSSTPSIYSPATTSPSLKSTLDQPRNSYSQAGSAVDRFRAKIMSMPESKQLFTGMEPGAAPGVLKVQVTNFWFEFKPHQKRQLIQMLADTWRAEAGTDTVIVHVYDFTGREIAGTKAFGGIWVENE